MITFKSCKISSQFKICHKNFALFSDLESLGLFVSQTFLSISLKWTLSDVSGDFWEIQSTAWQAEKVS